MGTARLFADKTKLQCLLPGILSILVLSLPAELSGCKRREVLEFETKTDRCNSGLD